MSLPSLPNPELGDVLKVTKGASVKETLGGITVVVAPNTWPNLFTLTYTFKRLSQTQKDDLVTFLLATAGLEIRFNDYLGWPWRGVVTNDPIFTRIGPSPCNWETTLIIEGVIDANGVAI